MREDGTHTKTEGRVVRAAALVAAIMLVFAAGAAGAAPAPEQKCEGGKMQAAGKYVACVAKAEKNLLLKEDAAKHSAAVAKCQTKLDDAYDKLEAAAEKKDAECPSVDDAEPVGEFLDECVDGVATALAGGDLPTCGGGAGGGLLVTGQTTPYGPGSDGDVQAGAARSFTDNGDGTITDNATGLMWEKKSDDGSIHNWEYDFTWSTGDNNMNGTMVTTFLNTLNNRCNNDESVSCTVDADCTVPGGPCGFAGHRDWRIPNLLELFSLVNLQANSPATYSEFNSGCAPGCTVTTCSCTRPAGHWSSTTFSAGPGSAWGVEFGFGLPSSSGKTPHRFVRAVRAGS